MSTDVLINKPCAFYARNAASGCYNGIAPSSLEGMSSFDTMFADVAGKPRAELKIPDDCTTDPQAEVLVFDDIEAKNIRCVATENKVQEQEIRGAYPHFGDDNVVQFTSFFKPRKDYEHWQ